MGIINEQWKKKKIQFELDFEEFDYEEDNLDKLAKLISCNKNTIKNNAIKSDMEDDVLVCIDDDDTMVDDVLICIDDDTMVDDDDILLCIVDDTEGAPKPVVPKISIIHTIKLKKENLTKDGKVLKKYKEGSTFLNNISTNIATKLVIDVKQVITVAKAGSVIIETTISELNEQEVEETKNKINNTENGLNT